MSRKKMLVCLLATLVVILPLALALPIAAVADGEPADGAHATLQLGPPPNLEGWYEWKGSATLYTWGGDKIDIPQFGYLCVVCQYWNEPYSGHKLSLWWFAGQPMVQPWCSYQAYVGPTYVDESGKIKNKPRLSSFSYRGEYCKYFENPSQFSFFVSGINACVKLDKYGQVKSIKGRIMFWEEYGTPYPDGSPQLGQGEIKFTAVPCTPPPIASESLPPDMKLLPEMGLPDKSH